MIAFQSTKTYFQRVMKQIGQQKLLRLKKLIQNFGGNTLVLD